MSTDLSIITNETLNPPVPRPVDPSILNSWLVSTINLYLQHPILEMASGHGSISEEFAAHGISLDLSDPDKGNRDVLRARFKGVESVRHVHNIDFCHPEFETLYTQVFGVFGTVIALNILETGFYDSQALRNARLFLRPGGHLIFMAPAYTAMFYGLDDSDDWKRYNRQALRDMLKSDFEILRTWYLNPAETAADPTHAPLGLSVLAAARKL